MPELFAYAPPWAWVTACGALALIYFLSWPRRKAQGLRRGPRLFALRWFHGLVWVLLGASLALHAVRDEDDLARTTAKVLAVVALLIYALFVFAAYGPRRSQAEPDPVLEPVADPESDPASDPASDSAPTSDDGVTGPRAR